MRNVAFAHEFNTQPVYQTIGPAHQSANEFEGSELSTKIHLIFTGYFSSFWTEVKRRIPPVMASSSTPSEGLNGMDRTLGGYFGNMSRTSLEEAFMNRSSDTEGGGATDTSSMTSSTEIWLKPGKQYIKQAVPPLGPYAFQSMFESTDRKFIAHSLQTR